MKRFLCIFTLVFIFCSKNPVSTSGDEIELRVPQNGSIVRTTQPEFDWYGLSGVNIYRIIIFTGSDTVVDERISDDSYTLFKFIPSGQYRWMVLGSSDGSNFKYSSPIWNFTLEPAPFRISSTLPMPGPVLDILPFREHFFAACNEAGVVVLNRGMDIVSRINTFDRAISLAVDSLSNLLFVADYRGNLIVYDISEIEHPELVNYYFVRRVVDVSTKWMRDTLFVIAADEDDGIVIFSMDPDGIFVQRGTPFPVGGYCNGIDISDTLIFAACNERGLKIVSFSNPDFPYLISELDLPGNAMDVVVNGMFCYVALGTSGLAVIDISNLQQPRSIFSYNPGIGTSYKVELTENYILLPAGTSGLFIFENPLSPFLIQQMDMPYTYSAKRTADGKFLAGDRDWGIVVIER